jgi:hypothetical protein
MTEPKDALDELSNVELALFIANISKELAKMAKERGLHTLVPSLHSAELASDNVLKKMTAH